ncbi:glycosyltransferase family 2 protein [Novosphingobium lentum]|uniref:glycosyltransferase family 2 protein n=1 Tax=Novosphingobium lentum TaxID=145287 RepID=UPI00147054A6|nr:glycosyltransferase family 2 protein [Novosphingobium lentum]
MKISVITVSYNAASEIDPTLRSVAGQTYRDIEYLVIDGGSTDGTIGIVQRYGDAIDTFVSEPDGGIYDAMNKALRLATGDAVIFMNAGDYFYSPYIVELAAEFMTTNPAADVVYGGIEVRYPDGRVSEFMPPDASQALDFLICGSLPHQGTFARRRAFACSGLFDTRWRSHADYDWFVKVASDPRIVLQRADFMVASFGLGGVSGQLERGERERHAIQNALPLYRQPDWMQKRIEAYQEQYIGLRLENERLTAS